MVEIIAIILGIICIFAILASPYFGLILFTLLLYLRPFDFIPALVPLHITRIFAGLTFLIMLSRKGFNLKSIFKNSTQMRLFSFLILIMIFSIVTSIWRGNSIKSFLEFLKLYIAFLLVINLIDSFRKVKIIIWIMVLSGLYISSLSIVNYFSNQAFSTSYRMHAVVEGMFNDPNDMALCFVMLLPFVYFLMNDSRSLLKRFFLFMCFVLFIIAVVLTYSRGGALGLAGVFVFIFLKNKKKIRTALLVSLSLFFLFYFAPSGYTDRIKTILMGYNADVDTLTRLDAWKAGIAMMTHRFFGVGVGNFGEGFVTYRPEGALDYIGTRRVAHNAFIHIGGETGILGFLTYALLIFFSFRELTKASKRNNEVSSFAQASWISLAGFTICSLFLSQAYNWILYYLIGFSVLVKQLGDKAKIQNK